MTTLGDTRHGMQFVEFVKDIHGVDRCLVLRKE